MAPSFTNTFSSREGLEEFENDDLQETTQDLIQAVNNIRTKKSKGRQTEKEENHMNEETAKLVANPSSPPRVVGKNCGDKNVRVHR